MSKRYCFVFFVFLICPLVGKGVDFNRVVINEIAWMGTESSANDEWIELFNNTENAINLNGWTIKSTDGTPEIKLTGIISLKSFYLLERTDDTTIPQIAADQIYTGALGNNGEDLNLYDNSGNLIDKINCSSGWFAGDNPTKQTMERINTLVSGNEPSNWQTSQNPGGTARDKNSIILATEEIKTEENPAEAEPQITYPTGIVFNEILPSPEGPDEQNEWIVSTIQQIPSVCSRRPIYLQGLM